MLQASRRISGTILWANSHLLFWLSLVPAATAWLGDHHNEAFPAATYGAVLCFAGIAYFVLQQCIIAQEEPGSRLGKAIGKDAKGIASVVLYLVAVGLAFVNPVFSEGIYVLVAAWWLVPDRRIESAISSAAVD